MSQPDYDDRDNTLISYDEIARVVEALPMLVREKRRRNGLSLRAAGEESGVSFTSIKRFEDGAAGIAWCNVVPLLTWVGLP